jgi:pyroglutamyl-peptidase
VTLPARLIVERLTGLGLPAELSDDAGAYLCNAVLFHGLLLSERETARCATGFIHIPTHIADTSRGPGLDWDGAVAGGIEIIRTCLGLSGGARR